jgi:TatD DNase family protein
VSVSHDLQSCKRNLLLSRKYRKVKPAFGFHPEQSMLSEAELYRLIEWMTQHQAEMIAIGEVLGEEEAAQLRRNFEAALANFLC